MTGAVRTARSAATGTMLAKGFAAGTPWICVAGGQHGAETAMSHSPRIDAQHAICSCASAALNTHSAEDTSANTSMRVLATGRSTRDGDLRIDTSILLDPRRDVKTPAERGCTTDCSAPGKSLGRRRPSCVLLRQKPTSPSHLILRSDAWELQLIVHPLNGRRFVPEGRDRLTGSRTGAPSGRARERGGDAVSACNGQAHVKSIPPCFTPCFNLCEMHPGAHHRGRG